MYYPTTPLELWIFLITLSAGFSTILTSIGVVAWKAYDKGRAWVFLVPEVPGMKADVKRVRLRKGELRVKVQGQDGVHERIICSDQAFYQTKKGPMWLIGASTGWNLIAPSKQDAPILYDAKMRAAGEAAPVAGSDMYARMLVADALAYEAAIENNDFGDFVNSKNERDPWQIRIAGMLVFLILGVLVAAGGVVWLISKQHGV